jgi:hypothetical protein
MNIHEMSVVGAARAQTRCPSINRRHHPSDVRRGSVMCRRKFQPVVRATNAEM